MSYVRRHSVKFVDQDPQGQSEIDMLKRKILDYDHHFQQSDLKIRRLEQMCQEFKLQLERGQNHSSDYESQYHYEKNTPQTQPRQVRKASYQKDRDLSEISLKIHPDKNTEYVQSNKHSEYVQPNMLSEQVLTNKHSDYIQPNKQSEQIHKHSEQIHKHSDYVYPHKHSDYEYIQTTNKHSDYVSQNKHSDYANKTFDHSNYSSNTNEKINVKDSKNLKQQIDMAQSKIIQDKKRLIDEEIDRRLKEEENKRNMITGPVENAQQVSMKQNLNRYSNPIHTTQKSRASEISNRLSLERKMKQDKISLLEHRAAYKNDFY